MPLLYARVPDIIPRQVDDSLFAAVPTTNTIHYLDPMAAAVWRSLAEPRTLRDLVELFAAAFPEQDRAVLRQDLRAVLRKLVKAALVVAGAGFCFMPPESLPAARSAKGKSPIAFSR